jgi:type I restriction enzyme S subunit
MAGEWRERSLGELTENFDGIRVPVKEADRRPGPYPYYGASGIVDYVDSFLFDGEYLLIAEDGENLRTRTTPVAFMARGKFWVNNHAHIVRGNQDTDTRFLMYALAQADISGYLTGSTMPKLTQRNMNRIPLRVPALPEQRAIAHILGTLDDKIELNRRMSETLEGMARALFKSWFVDFDPVRAKAEGRDPGLPQPLADLFPARLVDSDLGEIPEGWEAKSLDEIARFLNGLALQKYPPVGDRSLPVIKIAQLRAGNTTGADRASADLDEDYIVKDGDILFSWSGSLECVLWAGGEGALNQHLFKVTSATYPLWLCYLGVHLHLEHFRHIAAGKATTMGHIQRHHLSDAQLVVPRAQLLRAIAEHIEPIIESLWKRAVESRTLAAVRDALLPKLISGELRVKDAQKFIERTDA